VYIQKSSLLEIIYINSRAKNRPGMTSIALTSIAKSPTVISDKDIGRAILTRNHGSLSKE
jgi:hypothetical protein